VRHHCPLCDDDDDDGMTPLPCTDGERQSMKEAFNRERDWRIAADAVVSAQDEYIDFLDDYLNGLVTYLAVHSIGATNEEVDEGKRLRANIATAVAAYHDPEPAKGNE
jgi:hypothetical protein